MKRRTFISQVGKAAAAVSLPFLLPSGRLFAATGSRIANHVVLCLFSGGVRNIESMHMEEGNLMPNTIAGDAPISADIAPGMTPLPRVVQTPLQRFGTLFREFRFMQGPTAHVSGHLTTLTGTYFVNGHNPKKRSPYPTIFEYYRKHNEPQKSAINAWWIAERNDPFNICNYSEHEKYGPAYGANYFHPYALLGRDNRSILGGETLTSLLTNDKINNLRFLVNAQFRLAGNFIYPAFGNTPEDILRIDAFIKKCAAESAQGLYDDPYGIGKEAMNEDLYNIYFAQKVLTEFKPELLIVNMMAIDRGHTDFTLYCNNIRKGDYALARLWQTIQEDETLRDDTILIAVPEHGRNLKPNTLKDKYGRYALDHTSDKTSREIFCLVLGPKHKVVQNQVIKSVYGESIDIAATIARILGFHDKTKLLLKGKFLEPAFV
ncbi:MAG: hypothetical protein KatS3mg031_2011 [Chitinophagales bacterium]|nr:MAG: hypothetical protein KatS3mg031_2011 [Chitinophagales bacterium]